MEVSVLSWGYPQVTRLDHDLVLKPMVICGSTILGNLHICIYIYTNLFGLFQYKLCVWRFPNIPNIHTIYKSIWNIYVYFNRFQQIKIMIFPLVHRFLSLVMRDLTFIYVYMQGF